MSRPVEREWFSGSGRDLKLLARLAAMVLLVGCATGPPTVAPPEAARSHVYPLPLDTVLDQVAPVLAQKGWRVQKSADVLFTNWMSETTQSPQHDQVGQASEAKSLVGYRVVGERIDAGFCTIRVERLVATPSTLSFGQRRGGHVVEQTTTPSARSPTPVHNENRTLMAPFETLPEFAEDAPNESAATGVPSGMVVSLHERDTAMELELQEQIEPRAVATAQPTDARGALADAGLSAPQQQPGPAAQSDSEAHAPVAALPVAQRRPASLAGIWDGTFTFRGKVTGSFTGEVAVNVDGESVEIDDFCPESGGTLIARGSGTSASWQGQLGCPAIRLRGCPSATFTYNFVNATLNEDTLTVVAAGTIDTNGRCLDSGGELSVGGALSMAFIAQKADYVHIAVNKVRRPTVCSWPSDWEDFTSKGSMPMPEQTDDASYLGIIRAKGSRLNEIQRLLRHCRQVVLLHGQPVLMRLAVTRPHHSEMQ